MRKKNLGVFLLFLLFSYVLCTQCYVFASALSLDKIKIAFLQGDYRSAISEGEKVIASTSQNSPGLDELYYLLGLSYLKDGNYLRSSDIFEIILQEFKSSKFKDDAILGLGDTYFLRNNYDKAGQYYQKLLDNNRLKAGVYYRLSQCAFKQGNAKEGGEYLAKLKKDFPLDPELTLNNDLGLVPDSKDIYYTVQVGAFGSAANADNLKNRLIGQGYSAYVENMSTSIASSYRVRVGKFQQRKEALDSASKLSHEGYPTRVCP